MTAAASIDLGLGDGYDTGCSSVNGPPRSKRGRDGYEPAVLLFGGAFQDPIVASHASAKQWQRRTLRLDLGVLQGLARPRQPSCTGAGGVATRHCPRHARRAEEIIIDGGLHGGNSATSQQTWRPAWKSRRLRVMLVGAGVFTVLAMPLVWWTVSGLVKAGDKGVDLWVTSLIEGLAETHLNPAFTFTSLEYDYPRKVILHGCRLTAEDPGVPEGTIDVFEVDRLELELVEIPETGKPIQIERIILARPILRLVVHQADRRALVGFSDLLNPVEEEETPLPEEEGDVRAGDVLHVRSLSLDDGTVHYDPRRAGQAPMRLEGITMTMRIDPESTSLYHVDAVLERQPMLGFRVLGRLDADAMAMEVSDLALNIRLGRMHDHHLPPPLQELLQQYDVAADLDMKMQGRLLANDLGASEMTGVITLKNASFAWSDYRLPIVVMEVDAALNHRRFVFDRLQMETLGGVVTGTGSVDFADDFEAACDLAISEVRLEQLCRLAAEEDVEPRFAGRLDGTAAVAGPLRYIATQARGSGEVKLREGRVARFPVVSPIGDMLRGAMELLPIGDEEQPASDEVDITLTLEGDHAHCSSIRIRGAGFSVRGEGRIYFDTELDMKLNGGPLERIQENLGAPGKIVGRATDAIVKYIVRGTLDEPKIGVRFVDLRKTKPRKDSPQDEQQDEATATAPME